MGKILEIEARTWQREDLPGHRVRYHLPDEAKVTLDGAVMRTSEPQPETSSKATSPGSTPKPYESEIAQALLGKWTTDSQGRLVDHRTGRVTEATPNDPWPASVDHDENNDGVAALQQFQADHNNRPDQVYVDGGKTGQPGIDPGVRYSSTKVPGKLTLEFSPPVGNQYELPAINATAADPQTLHVFPPVGHQDTFTLRGPTVVTFTGLKAPKVPGRTAFVRVTDLPAQQMPTGKVNVFHEDRLLYTSDANGFDCQIAVGANVQGANVNVPEGATLRVEALGLSSNVLMDHRSADW